MVSPSKLQQQKQHPTKRTTTTTTTSAVAATAGGAVANIRIQRGSKPLEKKIFYLDLKNHALSTKLEAKIKELGGRIELFLVKNVSVVVTDRTDKLGQATTSDKRKWGYASGESGGPASLRSIEVRTPTATPPTPYHSVEGPLSNSTNQRGQTTRRSKSRVDAMLERALTQPQQCSVDPLNNALIWGIPIWTTYELQSRLEKICNSLKDSCSLKSDSRTGTRKEVKVKHLKEPYIKFESYRRECRPVFLELQAWPTLNFNGDLGSCPFDLKSLESKVWPTLNFDGDPGSCPFDLKPQEKKEIVCNKEIKENRAKYCKPNISKGKDMTRRPRATAARGRKTENTGYCEICRIDYRNLAKHLQSDQHLNYVGNDKNFLSLDNLISTGASVEAFLKINRSKDASKDCIFSSRDHSLDNGILSSDEKSEKRDKSNLNDFSIDEMKEMQCNGAMVRNLSLDSAHNLRTRAKHESGHLLRSKGRPLSEEQKPSEKSFDKYTIKKRAKGTIWIEENDSEDEKVEEKEQEGCDGKPVCDRLCEPETNKTTANGEISSANVSVNGDVDGDTADYKCKESNSSKVTTKDNAFRDSILETNLKAKVNGYERKEDKRKVSEVLQSAEVIKTKEEKLVEDNGDSVNCKNVDNVNNDEKLPLQDNDDTNSLTSLGKEEKKPKPAKRGGRSYRGRHRLSVEERLIEDNRDYYKVEVLGNKLRSSAIPSSNIVLSPSKEPEQKSKKDDKPSSEKPVVVRFKRVRKSELSLLSDEAESFMFGDPRRGDESDGDSVLPKDTESDGDEALDSTVLSSSPPTNVVPKQVVEDESQDSTTAGRARKRRRTQTEALIMDNTDYYKFETPGSRLRYQAPLTGISDPVPDKDPSQPVEQNATPVEEKVYPSKPSPEVEKMHFSFEAVPRSEPWYQTYQRQDEGSEYWHYFSEIDTEKPFLLPYEIENFHEILHKSLQNSVHRKRGRSRGGHINMGTRSPRKSPRCHASTLAIMSTIIRRREQQTNPVGEEPKAKPSSETAKSDKKCSEKSDVDEDLKKIVKNLDEMLSSNDIQEIDSFEVDLLKNADDIVIEPEAPPKGAPPNLLELLDNCHEAVPSNGIENSSCASSECGDLNNEFPSKRRKKRKNKTGWPGNKMRRKLHIKNLGEELQKELNLQKKAEAEEENVSEKKSATAEPVADESVHEEEDNEAEHDTGKENEQVLNTIDFKGNKGRRTKNKESKEYKQESNEVKDSEEVQSKSVLMSVFGEEISSRKKRSESSDNCKVEDNEIESQVVKGVRHLESKGTLSSVSEDSEASLSNNENVCTKDTNSLVPHDKNSPTKFTRKRQRKTTTSSEVSHSTEIENRRTTDTTPKKLQKADSDSQDAPLDVSNKSKRSKKLKQNDRTPSKVIFEDENCKKESFLTSNERRRLKRVRRNDSVSSELQNGEVDSTLSERVSPSLLTSDIDQRRSSIDFQPVVRVMKIDDQVDMDNSILSVAVASNRRLRSSSSPRSNMQPPTKRFRHGAGKRQFSGQWIKNS